MTTAAVTAAVSHAQIDPLDAFESALFRSGRSRNTVLVYRRTIRRFLESGISDPIDWLVHVRNSGASAASVRGAAAALKAWSRHTGDTAADVALTGYKLPAPGAPTPHPVPGGIEAVRRVLAGTGDVRTRTLIALGALAGLRVSESLSVDVRVWDRASNCLVIRGKGDKTRNVPVSTELETYLMMAALNSNGKFVPFSDKWARVQITRAFDSAGIKHANGDSISSHDLRATFATEVYRKNKDIRLVQHYLGHASVTQTQVYIGLADAAIKNGVNL